MALEVRGGLPFWKESGRWVWKGGQGGCPLRLSRLIFVVLPRVIWVVIVQDPSCCLSVCVFYVCKKCILKIGSWRQDEGTRKNRRRGKLSECLGPSASAGNAGET